MIPVPGSQPDMPKPNQDKTLLMVIYGVGLIFGLACVLWVLNTFRTQLPSVRWPVTQGQILQSELSRTPEDVRTGGNDGNRAHVTFRYTVSGREYKSQQITLWSEDLGWASPMAAPFVAKHPPQSVVDVYYDPENPEIAVLIPGANQKLDWLLFGAGAVCLFATLWGFGSTRRQRRLLRSLPDPAALARGSITRADFESAKRSFKHNFLGASGCVVLAMALLLPPVFSGPGGQPGSMSVQPLPLALGIFACLLAAYFFRRSIVRGRSIECPNCHNLFREYTRKTGRCEACGARAFSDEA